MKTTLGQDWYEKIESLKKGRTLRERSAKAVRLRADLEKLQHHDLRLTSGSYYDWKDYEKLRNILEAEINALKAEAEIDTLRDSKGRRPAKKASQIDRIKPIAQDEWFASFEDFKKIMCQLSIAPNLFVTKKSYEDAELIYEGHFTDTKKATDPNHRIDWIGIGFAYKIFHHLLIETQRIEKQPYSHFFAAHFLQDGDFLQDTKEINDWCADNRKNRDQPHEVEEKLKKIVF